MTREEIINQIKKRKQGNYSTNTRLENKVRENNKNSLFRNTLYKLLISSIILLLTLIIIKSEPSIKDVLKSNIYDNNMSFMMINNLYNKYLGDIIPFQNMFNTQNTVAVFNEDITYNDINDYQDGVILSVSDNYLVPIIESGLVVFIGQKDDYGYTVIIQGIDGVDIWYSNVEDINVSLYDYVSKAKPLANASNNELILVFNKEGEYLEYDEYIK